MALSFTYAARTSAREVVFTEFHVDDDLSDDAVQAAQEEIDMAGLR